jgi:hypothetical protein
MPKRHMDYMKCEVMRFFKLQHTKGLVEPISMTVPRKVSSSCWHTPVDFQCVFLQSDMFQPDIFPDCPSGESALSAEEWTKGETKSPKLVAFSDGGSSAAAKVRVHHR